jgi:multidrug resistance efflux pump
MTWVRKMRPVLIVLGLAVAVGSLVGARELTHAVPPAKAAGPNPRPAAALYVTGFVDSDPQPVYYGLPSVLPSGMVTAVHVTNGDEVKAGQKLYEFDTTIQTATLAQAKAGVALARARVKQAEEGAKQHPQQLKYAEQAVKLATGELDMARRFYTFVDKNLEKSYEGNYEKEKWEELKKSSQDLLKATGEVTAAENKLDLAKLKLDQVKAVDPRVEVTVAEEGVRVAEAEQAKAQSAVDLCVVKAKSAGTVEQLTIGPGTTLGVGTRVPALWVIPAGPRVVRAEVEAEFAHRVGPSIQGRSVTVYDNTDPDVKYPGLVRRVSSAFLPKRSTADNLLGGDTRVLEVVVEVTDAAPAGKPPLRVGQRVRVNLGQ